MPSSSSHPAEPPRTTSAPQPPDPSRDAVARRRWWADEAQELHRLLITSPWQRYRRDRDDAAEDGTVEP